MAAPALLVLLTVSASVSAARGQMDGCGFDLSTFLPSPFNSTGLSCRPIWNNFILRYALDQDNILSIVLSAVYASGWVGMGFSEDGMMIGSSAMVGWIGRDGRAHIKQFYLQGQSTSQVSADRGQLQLANNKAAAPAVVLYGVNMYLAFQLQLPSPATRQNLLFAFATATPANYRLPEHDDRISVSFDFSGAPSAGSPPSVTPSSYPYGLKRNHGALNILGWGVLLPLGAIIARYSKQWYPRWWYYLHVVVQFAGFMFGLAGVVAGVALCSRLHANVSVHRGLGILVFVLSILQVIAFFVRPEKDSKIRRYWNWYHHWVGRLALFLAAVNIVLGIHVGGAGPSWKVGYGVVLASIMIATTVLEVMSCARWAKKSVVPPAF